MVALLTQLFVTLKSLCTRPLGALVFVEIGIFPLKLLYSTHGIKLSLKRYLFVVMTGCYWFGHFVLSRGFFIELLKYFEC